MWLYTWLFLSFKSNFSKEKLPVGRLRPWLRRSHGDELYRKKISSCTGGRSSSCTRRRSSPCTRRRSSSCIRSRFSSSTRRRTSSHRLLVRNMQDLKAAEVPIWQKGRKNINSFHSLNLGHRNTSKTSYMGVSILLGSCRRPPTYSALSSREVRFCYGFCIDERGQRGLGGGRMRFYVGGV